MVIWETTPPSPVSKRSLRARSWAFLEVIEFRAFCTGDSVTWSSEQCQDDWVEMGTK